MGSAEKTSKNIEPKKHNKSFLRVFASVPKEYRNQLKDKRLETNVSRMYFFSIYIILLQIALNIINILKPSDTKGGNIMIYIILSMSTLVIGIIYCVFLSRARKGKIKSKKVKYFLVESLLYLYTAIQMTFCTLNILSAGGMNSYIIAILIIGMVPIIKPLQSILSISAALGYLLLAMYLARSHSNAWDSILITDTWANLLIITGITMCISVFMYDMYTSNFLKSIDLERSNIHLEELVHDRTKELEKQTDAAQVASKAKSEFLARMSHEIRTPLNAIMGMTQIARKAETKEKAVSSIKEIESASAHLMDILNDILDMSKIESGKFVLANEAFSLHSAIEEVENIIAMRCSEKKITFESNFREIPLADVMGDKLRFKQVLINLLGNAVKFTQSGGKIIFQLRLLLNTESDITITFDTIDNGIGMSEEQVNKLFGAFEQTDTSISTRFGGTGLGLAISQNLVERMGSRIEVKSKHGEGSKFSFTLKMKKAKAVQNPVSFDSDFVPDFAGKRLLIVEDIEINRTILIELLSDTNILIEEAEDGLQAIDKYSASPEGYYDLIFMDIQMPNLDGYAATREIRKLKTEDNFIIPIIAMTANAYYEDIQQALESGMNGHLAKPIDMKAVINVLKQWLA